MSTLFKISVTLAILAGALGAQGVQSDTIPELWSSLFEKQGKQYTIQEVNHTDTQLNVVLKESDQVTILSVEVFETHDEAVEAMAMYISRLPSGGLPTLEGVGEHAFGLENESHEGGTVYAVSDSTFVHVVAYSFEEAKRLAGETLVYGDALVENGVFQFTSDHSRLDHTHNIEESESIHLEDNSSDPHTSGEQLADSTSLEVETENDSRQTMVGVRSGLMIGIAILIGVLLVRKFR